MARTLVAGLWLSVGLAACSSSPSASPDPKPDSGETDVSGGTGAPDSGTPLVDDAGDTSDTSSAVNDAGRTDSGEDADAMDGSVASSDDARVPDEEDADTQVTLPEDAGPPLVVTDNLIANSSFEDPNALWFGFGNTPQLDVVYERAHTGRHALRVTQRHDVWAGPALDIGSWLTPGESYRFRVWVLGPEVTSAVTVSSQVKCATDAGIDEQYNPLHTQLASDDEWVELDATFDAPTCEGMEFVIYIEGPPVEVDFYIDDASLVLQD